jgi:hypothetical protein
MPTPVPHSFLRLNWRGGNGSRLVDFPGYSLKLQIQKLFYRNYLIILLKIFCRKEKKKHLNAYEKMELKRASLK